MGLKNPGSNLYFEIKTSNLVKKLDILNRKLLYDFAISSHLSRETEGFAKLRF